MRAFYRHSSAAHSSTIVLRMCAVTEAGRTRQGTEKAFDRLCNSPWDMWIERQRLPIIRWERRFWHLSGLNKGLLIHCVLLYVSRYVCTFQVYEVLPTAGQ